MKETILVNAGLIGLPVRYDSNHAQLADSDLLTQLSDKFRVVPICSELLVGLPTLRAAAETSLHNERIEVVDGDGQSLVAYVRVMVLPCSIYRR